MTTSLADAAKLLVQVTHAARVFDRLVDELIGQLRASRAAPVSREVTLGPAGTLGVSDAEVVAARERMDAMYPDFQHIYGSLLVEQLGAEHTESVLEALRSEPMQRYFRARRQMEQALLEGMGDLSQKLSDVMYQSRAA